MACHLQKKGSHQNASSRVLPCLTHTIIFSIFVQFRTLNKIGRQFDLNGHSSYEVIELTSDAQKFNKVFRYADETLTYQIGNILKTI